jgi:hypothetical protein
MFSDREIEHFLGQGYGDPNAASYFGWLAKMANFANLVSVNEGNAMRELTELHRNASRMVTRYEGYAPAMGKGRARIGYISRSVGYA